MYFKADPQLTRLFIGLENSDMMVSCMCAKGSWGVATISTPSAGYGDITRMACVHVRSFGILLQNLITHHAVKK